MDITKNSFSYSESTSLLERRAKNDIVVKGSALANVKCRLAILFVFLLAAVVCIAVGVVLAFFLAKGDEDEVNSVKEFQHAAVATDATPCSVAGAQVLKQGGSAVDAAVASTFCVGVFNLQSTGIGGGGFLIHYRADIGRSVMFDFREVAPSNISRETMEKYINDDESTTLGGLAVAVPGQVKGLYEAWQQYGLTPWKDLLQPAIELAREGFEVTEAIEIAINSAKGTLDDDRFQELRNVVAPNGKYLKKGEILKQTALANTLEAIAEHGSSYFYNSTFTKDLVAELQSDSSEITLEDFQNYEVKMREVVVTNYSDYSIHSTTLPGGGPVVSLIFNILDGFGITPRMFNEDRALSYHRVIEAFKFSYGQRLRVGDPDYNSTIREILRYILDPETAMDMRSLISDNTTHGKEYYMDKPLYNPLNRGTTHLSVYAENGDAVVTTNTINTYFGSKLSSKSGVIFNNEMDDFSVQGRNNSFGYPPTPANYIRPNHRPLSSMSPTIVTKEGRVVMAVGASGGSMIPTAVSQIMLDLLSFNKTLSKANSDPRLHDQLLPEALLYEPKFPAEIVKGLEERGHDVVESNAAAVVQTIYIDDDGLIHAASDPRKGGTPDGY